MRSPRSSRPNGGETGGAAGGRGLTRPPGASTRQRGLPQSTAPFHVKHPSPDADRARALALVPVPSEAQRRLAIYVDLLDRWRRVTNLISAASFADAGSWASGRCWFMKACPAS